MNKIELFIENRVYAIYSDNKPEFIIIQPTDQRVLESLDKEIEHIKSMTDSPFAKSIYLSLGKKEEKTRNRTMASADDNIRRQYEIFKESDINRVLEWNEGNHFTEPKVRTAKGFAWCINSRII